MISKGCLRLKEKGNLLHTELKKVFLQNDSKLNNYNLLNLLESTDGYSMSILIHLLVKQLALIFFPPNFITGFTCKTEFFDCLKSKVKTNLS